MAIAFGALLGTPIFTGTNATSYTMASGGTPAADSLVIAAVGWERATLSAVPTFSGGSLTWSTLQDQVSFDTIASPTASMGWFWAAAGASPGSCTGVMDFAGETQIGAEVVLFTLTGTDVTTPRVQGKTNRANSGSGSLDLDLDALVADTSATVVIGKVSATVNQNPRTDWTEITGSDDTHANPGYGFAVQYRLAPSEKTGTIDPASGTTALAMVMIEIAILDSGATQPPRTMHQFRQRGD